MRRFIIVYGLVFFAVQSGIQIDSQSLLQQQTLANGSVETEARKLVDKVSSNQIFIQQLDQNGENTFVARGPEYKIPGNPKTGEPDMLPPNSLTAIIGQTPLHTNYQVIHYPRFKTTPLNLESFPRIYTPLTSPQHPLNMHHPFNNLYGMHPYMYTGDPTSSANLFMNPFAHAMTGMFANNVFPTAAVLNGGASNVSSEAFNQQSQALSSPPTPSLGLSQAFPIGNSMNLGVSPGFNPMYAGMGPFGGGFGAYNSGMSSLGPWAMLSPKNIGDERELRALLKKIKKRNVASQKKSTNAAQLEDRKTASEVVSAENNKA